MKRKPVKICWSRDNENFRYDSLHELIENEEIGGDWGLNVGDVVYFGEKNLPNPNSYIDVNDIIDMIGDRACDDCGEYAEDYPDVSKEAFNKLDKYLKRWLKQNCQPHFWLVGNVQSYILTEADLASFDASTKF